MGVSKKPLEVAAEIISKLPSSPLIDRVSLKFHVANGFFLLLEVLNCTSMKSNLIQF